MVTYNSPFESDESIKQYAKEFSKSMIPIFEKAKSDLENEVITNALNRMKNNGIEFLTISSMPTIRVKQYSNLELENPNSVNLMTFEKYMTQDEFKKLIELKTALQVLYSCQ